MVNTGDHWEKKAEAIRAPDNKEALANIMIKGRAEDSRGSGRTRGQREDDLKQCIGWSMEGLRKGEGERERWWSLMHDLVRPRPGA